jgi:hypothetical protein
MDDCGIFTHKGELDLHRKITRDFFTILRKNSLFLKPSKCLFEVIGINFLGLRLTSAGITITPDKLSAIADWPRTPRNLKDLRKVLGVLGYQCPFILGFASIARPMTALLKKGADFIWTKECLRALDTLIKVVCSSPVLVAPNQNRQFELEVDASQFALGAILWQRDPASPKKLRAVSYYSSMLNPAEMNYKIHDQELLAIIRALCHWSHLLCMTVLPIIIWTDHKNLTYWAAPQKVGPRAATWQVELQQYNYELRHKPGEQNKADALSRQPDYDRENPMNSHLIVLPLDHFAGMPLSILESLEQHPHIKCSACM